MIPSNEEKKQVPSLERRYTPVAQLGIQVVPCEKRSETQESTQQQEQRALTERKIVGHAAVFNVLSDDLSPFSFEEFREKIQPGAFADVLDDDVRALFNHDANQIIARTANKTVLLSEDDIGLKVEIQPADTQLSRDLLINIESGNVNQMSFAFIVAEDIFEIRFDEANNKDIITRTIVKFKELFDVSPVTFPAFPQTDAVVRSQDNDNINDVEIRSNNIAGIEYRSAAQLSKIARERTGYKRRSGLSELENYQDLLEREITLV